jgi:hypothetical protein
MSQSQAFLLGYLLVVIYLVVVMHCPYTFTVHILFTLAYQSDLLQSWSNTQLLAALGSRFLGFPVYYLHIRSIIMFLYLLILHSLDVKDIQSWKTNQDRCGI